MFDVLLDLSLTCGLLTVAVGDGRVHWFVRLAVGMVFGPFGIAALLPAGPAPTLSGLLDPQDPEHRVRRSI